MQQKKNYPTLELEEETVDMYSDLSDKNDLATLDNANGKIYILDTNILMDDNNAIYGFEDNTVCITDVTIAELDGLKKALGETGYSARQAIRKIAGLCKTGNLLYGIKLENGGTFRVLKYEAVLGDKSLGYGNKIGADDKILAVCDQIRTLCKNETVLVTNDTLMQIKANVSSIPYQDYKNTKAKDSNYTGRRIVSLPDNKYDILIHYLNDKTSDYTVEANDIEVLCGLKEPIHLNEIITLSCGNMQVQTINKRGILTKIKDKKGEEYPCGITPRNSSQKAALELLQDDNLPLVIMKGPAGCAKTFLALAAGLDGVFEGKWEKVSITRNNVLMDAEHGYLSGDLEEKMYPLLGPFFDNLVTILRGKHGRDESKEQIQMQIRDLIETGMIEIVSVAYMRGRTFTNTFLIVDEVQNTTSNQALSIVSRIGEGSKIVLCGDPDQIDLNYLSKENNGLAFTSDRMKDSELCGQFTFTNEESVRSPLAYEAAKRMKL